MKQALGGLLVDLVLLVLAMIAIMVLWESTLLSTGALLLLVIVGFVFFYKKEDIVFYCMGFVFGLVAELCGVNFGVWVYHNPVVFGIPLWLPLMWGFGFMLARRFRDAVFKLEHEAIHYEKHPSLPAFEKIFTYDLLFYVMSLLLLILLFMNNYALFVILLIILVLHLMQFHRKEDVFFVIFGIIIGIIIEVLGTAVGVWSYTNPTILRVPIWIPVGYGIIGIVVRRMAVNTVNFLYRNQAKE